MKAVARNKCARMSLEFGIHAAWFVPVCRLVGEIGVVPPHLVRRPPDRALEQVGDSVLQDLIGGQTERILDPLSFEALIDTRHGEGSIGPEKDSQDLALIAHDHRLWHALPAPAAVYVDGT